MEANRLRPLLEKPRKPLKKKTPRKLFVEKIVCELLFHSQGINCLPLAWVPRTTRMFVALHIIVGAETVADMVEQTLSHPSHCEFISNPQTLTE